MKPIQALVNDLTSCENITLYLRSALELYHRKNILHRYLKAVIFLRSPPQKLNIYQAIYVWHSFSIYVDGKDVLRQRIC